MRKIVILLFISLLFFIPFRKASAYSILNIIPGRVDSWPGQPNPPTYPGQPGVPVPPTPQPPQHPPTPGYPGGGYYESPQQLFTNGQTYYNQGDYFSAIQSFKKLLERYPYDYKAGDACFLTAEAYRRLNDYANAITYYRKVTISYQHISQLDRAAYYIAFCYIKLNNYYTAISELNNFTARFGTSNLIDDAWYILGRTYEKVNDKNNAIRAYQVVVYKYPYSEFYSKARDRLTILQNGQYPSPTYPNPTYPTPPEYPGTPTTPVLSDRELYDRGHSQLAMGNFNNAVIYFNELRKRYPNSYLADDALLWIAKTRYQQKNYAEAIKQFESFRNYYPSSDLTYDALFGLAYAEYELALTNASYRIYFSRAANHFILFQQTYPNHKWSAEALYMTGQCNEHLGDYNTAKYYYRQVIDLYPNSPSAISAKDKLNSFGLY